MNELDEIVGSRILGFHRIEHDMVGFMGYELYLDDGRHVRFVVGDDDLWADVEVEILECSVPCCDDAAGKGN